MYCIFIIKINKTTHQLVQYLFYYVALLYKLTSDFIYFNNKNTMYKRL
jgi:hypothetical protein